MEFCCPLPTAFSGKTQQSEKKLGNKRRKKDLDRENKQQNLRNTREKRRRKERKNDGRRKNMKKEREREERKKGGPRRRVGLASF